MFHTFWSVPCTVCCFACKTFVPSMFGVCVNFKNMFFNALLYNSVVKWRWERDGWKTDAIIYRQQQQHVHSRTAQLSGDSRGPTCIADLDSGARALSNAQNRPALLQLNRLLGTAVPWMSHPYHQVQEQRRLTIRSVGWNRIGGHAAPRTQWWEVWQVERWMINCTDIPSKDQTKRSMKQCILSCNHHSNQ